jgi:hypothetical protein
VVEDEDCCVEDDEYGADDADNDDCEDECDDSSQDSGVESDEDRSEDDSLGEEGEDFSKILSQSPPDSMQKHAH